MVWPRSGTREVWHGCWWIGVESDLAHWLVPFLARLPHRARQTIYRLHVTGLIGPGERKSVKPIAERLGLATCSRVHHFVLSAACDATPLEAEL